MTARALVACGLGVAMLTVSGDGRAQDERSTIAPLPGLETWDGLAGGEPAGAADGGGAGETAGAAPAAEADESETAEPAAAERETGELPRAGDVGEAPVEVSRDGAAGSGSEPAEAADGGVVRLRAAENLFEGERPALSGLEGEPAARTLDAAGPAAAESVPVTSAGAGRQGAAPVSSGPAPSPPVSEAPEPRGSLWRLLDARAERAAGETAAAFVADMAREGCPRDLLGRLLAAAADERGALSALALEREILVLCRKRQDAVAAVLTQEAALRGMVAGGGPARAPAVAASAPADWAAAIEVVPQLGLADDAGGAPLEAEAEAERLEEAQAAHEAAREPAPAYRWFTLTGSAGDLRAGVTDGIGVWFVRSGDALPGELWVSEISAAPPAVRVAGAAAGALPWGAPP